MMKALVIGYHVNRDGGIESVTLDIAHALHNAGYDVELWALMDAGVREVEGFRVVGFLPSLGWARSIHARASRWVLAAALAVHRPHYDLCISAHAFLAPPLAWVRRMGWMKSKVVVWSHGIEVWGHMAGRIARHRAGIDRFVAVSEYTASHLRPHLPAGSVTVIPNAVAVERFSPLPTGDVTGGELLIVGRLSREERYKGHEQLLHALAILRSRDIAVRLTVIGDGNDRTRLQQVTRHMGLDTVVTFRGRVSRQELVEAYRRCFAFVMPSFVARSANELWKGEGFGLVYIEAAACGRPVIASSEGGAAETIVDGETGLFVNPHDPADIADKIQALLANETKADEMGERGRALVEDRFSFEVFGKNVRNLLRGLGVACNESGVSDKPVSSLP